MFFVNLNFDAANPRQAIGRLRTVYFVLAAFDLFTIGAALTLDHAITSALERHVRVSRELSDRMTDLFDLQHAAQAVGAPGNDVFDAHDIARQRAVREQAILDFRAEWNSVITAPAPAHAPGYADTIAHLQTANRLFDGMVDVSENIFLRLERRDLREAGRFMAEQDRLLAQLVTEIESAVTSVERVQIHLAEEQLGFARSARQLEIVIAIALLGIIVCVVMYGMHLGRVQRQYEATLEDANRKLKHYADDVSHELRGPVNKLRLNLETLLGDEGATQEYKDNVAASVEDCESLSRIINGLLFIARVENMDPSKDLRRDTFSLDDLFDGVSDFFSATAEQRGITIAAQPSPLRITADRPLMQRALANLVSNSVSHTPTGGRIELSAHQIDDKIEITVKDNGSGIEAERLPHVFKRFNASGDDTKPDGAGLGLGLSITKAIVDLHAGEIAIDSTHGAGATVTIRLPATA
ncbi:MAG: sensor histidine kinase [Hyphomonadaceae bacterium]